MRFPGLRTWAAAKSKGSWPDTTATWLETAAATRFNHDLLLLYRFYVGPPSADKPALIPKSVLARVVERLEEEFWTRYKQKHANKAIAFPVHLRHMLLLTQQPQEAVIAFLERASIVQRQVQARRPPDTPPLPE